MSWHIAQLNVALPLEPLDSARLADFMAALDPVNALADSADGFVWRLQSDGGDATDIRGTDDQIIINMSVWTSLAALRDFVFGGTHVQVMRRRREWFTPMQDAYTVLWWVPAGSRPDVADAERRLDLLRRIGPSADAFTFKVPFLAPDGVDPEPDDTIGSDRSPASCGVD